MNKNIFIGTLLVSLFGTNPLFASDASTIMPGNNVDHNKLVTTGSIYLDSSTLPTPNLNQKKGDTVSNERFELLKGVLEQIKNKKASEHKQLGLLTIKKFLNLLGQKNTSVEAKKKIDDYVCECRPEIKFLLDKLVPNQEQLSQDETDAGQVKEEVKEKTEEQ